MVIRRINCGGKVWIWYEVEGHQADKLQETVWIRLVRAWPGHLCVSGGPLHPAGRLPAVSSSASAAVAGANDEAQEDAGNQFLSYIPILSQKPFTPYEVQTCTSLHSTNSGGFSSA